MRNVDKWKAYLHQRRFYYRILFSFAALCICTVALTAGLPEAAAAALIATPVLGALARAGLIEKK